MKQIQKSKLMDEVGVNFARTECAVHSQFDHDNIVKLYEYTENESEFVLFMEYCNDANYFDDKLVEVSKLGATKIVFSKLQSIRLFRIIFLCLP